MGSVYTTMTTPNPQLNGIDLTDLQSALDEIAQQPEARHAGKRSRIQWLGGFRFNSFVRNNTFIVEEPASTSAPENAPNAMEYVLGALGCLPVPPASSSTPPAKASPSSTSRSP